MDISPYLDLMIEKEGSDLYFTTGATPKVKVDGKMASVGSEPITKEQAAAAVLGIMDKEQAEFFLQKTWRLILPSPMVMQDGSGLTLFTKKARQLWCCVIFAVKCQILPL